MGWWTKKEYSEQSHAQEDQDSDEIHKDVLAAGRVSCYKARDTFFACVEKSKSKPTEVASVGLLYPAECKAARSEFVKQCRPTWTCRGTVVDAGLPDVIARSNTLIDNFLPRRESRDYWRPKVLEKVPCLCPSHTHFSNEKGWLLTF